LLILSFGHGHDFASCFSWYHQGLDNVTLADIYYGRRAAILAALKGAPGSDPRTTAHVQPRPSKAAHSGEAAPPQVFKLLTRS